MSTLKFCLYAILPLCILEGCNSSKGTSGEPHEAMRELVIDSRQHNDDYQLVDSMIVFGTKKFQNLTPKQIALIYVYFTSCHNEDASEGIYYNFGQALSTNEKTLNQVIQWGLNFGEKYDSEFIDCILLCFISLYDTDNPSPEYLRSLIPDEFVAAYYNTPDGKEYLRSKLEFYSSNYCNT